MERSVTIVMYHYVRDLARSRFPAIKALSLERFRRQLEYIGANFTPVTLDNIIEALAEPKRDLPPNAILLTFDDGYSDHFLNVFPLLDSKGIKGCFFPPAQAVLEHKVLDVNKIQFVLATVPNTQALVDQLFTHLNEFRSQYNLKSKEAYISELTGKHRYDTMEVTFFKRILQRALPGPVRAEIVNRMFLEHVTQDEASFACELYMSADQIKCMYRHGMHFGSHGYSHIWLNEAPHSLQVSEVDQSLRFLRELGVIQDGWTICYPFGGHSDSVHRVVGDRKCRLGFTVEMRIADLDSDQPLTLPRIDTNDLPS